MSEYVGIMLHGGPLVMDGWNNIYDGDPLGGWPLPERIAAFEPDIFPGKVAVSKVDDVPDSYQDQVTYYRKVKQSELAEADPQGVLVRGAVYEVET